MPVRQTAELNSQRKRLKLLIVAILAAIVLSQIGPFAAANLFVRADTVLERTGTVSVNSANIRTSPNTSSTVVCTLSRGHIVNVHAVTTGQYITSYGDQWYQVSFDYSGSTLQGYVVATFITLDPIATTTITTTLPPTTSASEITASETILSETTASETIITDTTASETGTTETTGETSPTTTEDFEAMLTSEGFPESYKAGLRALHELYPTWVFRSLNTNLDWETVITNENYKGRSLVSMSDSTYGPDGYRSTEDVAYDWATNIWVPYDGSSWVMCNKDVIRYYMDPRNFFTLNRVFMFEALNFQPGTQTLSGVEKILAGSFMANKSFSYVDAASGETRSMLYSEAFMKAAAYSGVSPYHLASRCRVEIGSNGSSSVSGTFSADLVAAYAKRGVTYVPTAADLALDGIFNFYNIGASSSTELLGNVRNGLTYARDTTKHLFTLTEFNPTYVVGQTATAISWTNRLRSIVGGSMFIGTSYINVGQNTLYLQKFDVDNSDGKLYWHQYMGSIYAPYVESKSIYNAYAGMGLLDEPMTFIIPIYKNMPATACQLPTTANPNNWLKSLSVNSYSLTPTFDPAKTGDYSLIVENDVTSITVAAAPVTSKATVTGTGTIQLAVGSNTVKIVVTAENGSKRTYTLTVVRKSPAVTPTPTASPTPTGSPTLTPTPTLSPTPTVSAAPTAAVTPAVTLSPTPSPTPVPVLTSKELTVGTTTISGLNPSDSQNTVSAITAELIVPSGCTVSIVKADDSACTGLVGTGCKIRLISGGKTIKEYTVIVFGDVNGDGKVNAIDNANINWQLLRQKTLSGIYAQSADASHDGKVNAIDMYTIVRHMLRMKTIDQQ